jgi:hypothetical protein
MSLFGIQFILFAGYKFEDRSQETEVGLQDIIIQQDRKPSLKLRLTKQDWRTKVTTGNEVTWAVYLKNS